MALLRLALLQLTPAGDDIEENLVRGLTACEHAAAGGADIALFPEMWQIGYTPCPLEAQPRADWIARAIGPDDPWLEAFRAAARRLELAIVATYLERWPGAPRNAATLLDRRGEPVLTYAKVHTSDFSMESALTSGDGFRVATLETRLGPVEIGIMICFDRESPESARALMLGGAELILTPNACRLDEDRIGQFRARAFENMVAVAMANYPAPQHNGHSCAFDGVATLPGHQSRDHRLVVADDEPGIVFADLDLDLLREHRARGIWGDAYRHPGAYRSLVDEEVRPPFVRADARRSLPPKVSARS